MGRSIALAVLLVATGACARSAPPPFSLTPAGSNVWAAIDSAQVLASSGSNAGFVIGADAVIVVDTFANADAARQLLAAIRRQTKLPVKYAVNTHHHFDHVAGNGVLAASGAILLAHRAVADWIHSENLRMVTEGAAAAHETLTAEQVALVRNLVPPTAPYDEAVDLQLQSPIVHVRHLPGHTGGDSLVIIPEAKVVFTGDLFWNRVAPNTVDASTQPWIETLTELLGRYDTYTFVPGHGAIGKAGEVLTFRDYLMALRQLVGDAQAEGRSGDAVVDAVLPRLAAPYREWAYFKEVAPSEIRETDAELRGTKRVPQP